VIGQGVTSQTSREERSSGRVRLRPNRGFQRCPAQGRHPLRIEETGTRPRMTLSPGCKDRALARLFLGAHIIIGVTRQAPAQAELRPTCAAASHVALLSASSPTHRRDATRPRVTLPARVQRPRTSTTIFGGSHHHRGNPASPGSGGALPWLPSVWRAVRCRVPCDITGTESR
jgi:hypothetical protein